MAEPVSGPRVLSPRQIELAERAERQRTRVARFTPVAGRRRWSTRGERGETWRTKRWTNARWRDLADLDNPNLDLCARLDARARAKVA